jgi:hypothetical protein
MGFQYQQYQQLLFSLVLLLGYANGLSILNAQQDSTVKEVFPVSGTIQSGFTFNHNAFVGDEQSAVAKQYGLGKSSGFATGGASLSLNIFYSKEFSKKYEPIAFFGGVGFRKPLFESYNRAYAAGATTQPDTFLLSDVNINASWSTPVLIENLDINWSMYASVPYSRSSRAYHNMTTLSPSLALTYSLPFHLVLQLAPWFAYNVNSAKNNHVNCELMPTYCQVSTGNLGGQNLLWQYGGTFSLNYPILQTGVSINAAYDFYSGSNAISYQKDPYMSEFAQTGTQYNMGIHGVIIGVRYGFRDLSSASAIKLNESLEAESKQEDKKEIKKKKKKESSFLQRLSIGLSMRTYQNLYSADNKRITIPLFDFETKNKERTFYTISINLAF